MDLVVDTNVLVGELLGERGQRLFLHPGLNLYIAEAQWGEAQYELPRRVQARVAQGRLSQSVGEKLLHSALRLADDVLQVVPLEVFAELEVLATRRIPRDASDQECSLC